MRIFLPIFKKYLIFSLCCISSALLADGAMAATKPNPQDVPKNFYYTITSKISLFTKQAEKGDVNAMISLSLYYFDRGFPEKSFYWSHKALPQSHLAYLLHSFTYFSEPEQVREVLNNLPPVEQDILRTSLMSWKEKNIPTGLYLLGLAYQTGALFEQNTAQAIACYEQAGKLGDVLSFINLGMLYDEGVLVEKDYAKAFAYYDQAVKKNSATGAMFIAFGMSNGKFDSGKPGTGKLDAGKPDNGKPDTGKPDNTPDAATFEFIKKAASLGHYGGLYLLALYYENGYGTKPSPKDAQRWYQKSAETGNIEAQLALGRMFLLGTGSSKNYQLALQWLEKAEQQNTPGISAEAAVMLATMYTNGLGVQPDKEKTLAYLTKAAATNNPVAQLHLGAFAQGEGKHEEAFQWFERAALQKNADAAIEMGAVYQYGRLGTPDKAKAIEWYNKAIEYGNSNAIVLLGMGFESGTLAQSGNPDMETARSYYVKAHEAKNYNGTIALGRTFYNEQGSHTDLERAFALFKIAAEANVPEGLSHVALFYEKGLLGEVDKPLAKELYLKAAYAGDELGLARIQAIQQAEDQERMAQQQRNAQQNNAARQGNPAEQENSGGKNNQPANQPGTITIPLPSELLQQAPPETPESAPALNTSIVPAEQPQPVPQQPIPLIPVPANPFVPGFVPPTAE